MKVQMENDGGKPANKLPSSMGENGRSRRAGEVLERNGATWRILGEDSDGARVFAKSADGNTTAWLAIVCPAPEAIEVHESAEPVDVVCTCSRGPDGFSYDAELDLWVHYVCGKPKRLYLQTLSKEFR